MICGDNMSYTPRILIVDDEPRMCGSLKILLSGQGYEIYTCNSGKEAIDHLDRDDFDLLLLDMILPDMDGYQIMDYLNNRNPEVPVIIMTGHVSVESAVKVLRQGAYDYLKKPFEIEELLKRVENAINQKKLKEERNKLEAKLRHDERMMAMGTMAGGIAHDFNNLLMAIQGNVSLMLLDIDPAHLHYERLKSIEKQVESGSNLTTQLLRYAGREEYEVGPVDLNQLVKETSETFGRTRKAIRIHRKLAEDLLAVEANRWKIEQVLLNLYLNAADAMSGSGDLILKTVNITHDSMERKEYDPKPGKYVLLTVSDTGSGIDEKTMVRIFEPFFTTKEMGRGTGLGLASVYAIIKSHGGYIDVNSLEECGTTFSIYFPATNKAISKDVKTSEEIDNGSETILLVDDEESILAVNRELVEAMGYHVLIARDGREAIEVYKNNRDSTDMVLLDMIMPDMGGGETYDRLKEINPDIKVLLLSGYSSGNKVTELLERGCNGFIQKPFKIQELSKKIRKILKG